MAHWFSYFETGANLCMLYTRRLRPSHWCPFPLYDLTPSIQTYTLGEISNQTAEVPYPNLELNTPSGGLSTVIEGIAFGSNSQDTFISVQALFITPDDTLWVLDTGRPTINATSAPTMPYASPGGPKLCSINLANNSITKTYTFPPDVHFPDSYMNDLRFDMRTSK